MSAIITGLLMILAFVGFIVLSTIMLMKHEAKLQETETPEEYKKRNERRVKYYQNYL